MSRSDAWMLTLVAVSTVMVAALAIWKATLGVAPIFELIQIILLAAFVRFWSLRKQEAPAGACRDCGALPDRQLLFCPGCGAYPKAMRLPRKYAKREWIEVKSP